MFFEMFLLLLFLVLLDAMCWLKTLQALKSSNDFVGNECLFLLFWGNAKTKFVCSTMQAYNFYEPVLCEIKRCKRTLLETVWDSIWASICGRIIFHSVHWKTQPNKICKPTKTTCWNKCLKLWRHKSKASVIFPFLAEKFFVERALFAVDSISLQFGIFKQE